MTWHPILQDADPEAAWYGPDKLAAIRRSEEITRAIARRDRFEAAFARLSHPTPEQIRELWAQVDEDPEP